MDDSGNFLVTWQSSHQDGFSWGIYGREYAANGNTIEHEFLVNTRVQGPQTNPAVGVNSQGNAVVVWLGLDANHTPAVQAQRYQLPMVNPNFTVGGEIVLANYVALEEAPPSAAMNARREFVVVWESYEDTGDYSGLGIFGRRFDREGNPLGDAFLVNTTTLNNQSHPDVASDTQGNFVVVWEADDQDGSGHGIFAQLYDSAGNKIGGEFQVNTTTAGDQGFPSVAMQANGDFVVAWQGPDADGNGIFARRFQADGTPVDSLEFPVNSQTALDQFSPDVAINEKGQFVIAWVSDHLAVTNPELMDSEKSIFVQWFDSDGSSTGEEVLVHSLNPAYDAQEAPAVAINENGDFTVVFQSINQDGNSWGVFARQFLADKTPVQPMEFQVNETTQGPQRFPAIVMDQVGNFVISWQSNHQDESSWAIFNRAYSRAGVPLTGEMQVNTYGKGPQVLPAMAGTPEGGYGIFWLGQGTDQTEGVQGRLYVTPRIWAASVHGQGQPPTVAVYEGQSDQEKFTIDAYPNYLGSVRIALGDVNADGTPDIITAPGPGGGPHIHVFDGVTGEQLPGLVGSFMAYDLQWRGGVYVASADLDGDGFDDIITGADAGGGPDVRVFSGQDGHLMYDLYAYDPNWSGGVRVAAGDVNDDGTPEIITAPGPGGGPNVRVFDGKNPIANGAANMLPGAIGNYYAYDSAWTGGVNISAGEFDGLPGVDVVTSAGATGGPHVRVAEAESFNGFNYVVDFMAYDSDYRGGVSVATTDYNGDGTPDILTGQLEGPDAEVRIFDGTTLPGGTYSDIFPPLVSFTPSFPGGAFVTGNLGEGIGLGSPLRAADAPAPSGADSAPLTQEQLAETVQAAIGQWQSLPLSAQQQADLANVQFSVRDLPGDLLGLTRLGQIVLDVNAAGFGWFVDPTPEMNTEFGLMIGTSYQSTDPIISSEMDVLTVVNHELAHLLGAEDLQDGADSTGLMAPTLTAGTRKIVDRSVLDQLFSSSDVAEALLAN